MFRGGIKLKLAVVGDEIGTSLEEQIESLHKANISYIELRKVSDKYLWEFSKIWDDFRIME